MVEPCEIKDVALCFRCRAGYLQGMGKAESGRVIVGLVESRGNDVFVLSNCGRYVFLCYSQTNFPTSDTEIQP